MANEDGQLNLQLGTDTVEKDESSCKALATKNKGNVLSTVETNVEAKKVKRNIKLNKSDSALLLKCYHNYRVKVLV